MPKVNKPKNTNIQEQLAQKLQALRQQKGVSQAEMAKYIDLTVGAYQNYENGRREANYETLCKLADFYNVSTDYLLGRTTVKQTAKEPPDPFANIDVSALEKRIIKKYTELDESTRALCIELFLRFNPDFNAVFQGITQSTPQNVPQPIEPPEQVQPSKPNIVQKMKDSEFAVARGGAGYKKAPTDEQLSMMEEVTPDMLGD